MKKRTAWISLWFCRNVCRNLHSAAWVEPHTQRETWHPEVYWRAATNSLTNSQQREQIILFHLDHFVSMISLCWRLYKDNRHLIPLYLLNLKKTPTVCFNPLSCDAGSSYFELLISKSAILNSCGLCFRRQFDGLPKNTSPENEPLVAHHQ